MRDSPSSPQPVDLTRFRYLIVDDEPFSRHVIAGSLRTLGCLKLVFASDGMEALDRLEKSHERIDLVLSDFQMPNMTGLQLLKSIRCGMRGISNKTIFGILTGYSDRDIVGAAFRLDVDAFLTKPISQEGLKERLEYCFRQDRVLEPPAHYEAVNVDITRAMSVEVPAVEEIVTRPTVIADGLTRLGPTPIEQVEEGAILVGDLTTSTGEVILRDGQVLRRRVIGLLHQLSEIDPVVQMVDIAVRDP